MKKHLVQLSFLTLLFAACKKDKDLAPVPEPILNAPELVTSMTLKFVDSANTANVTFFSFRDPDGSGGNAPVKFDTIKLASNRTYSVTTFFIDETKTPTDTINDEIWSERNDHQVFFTYTGVNLSTTYLDKDNNNYPVGLSTKWRSGAAGNGTSKVVLKHQAGTKNGTTGPGETDVEVNFQTKIQ